VNDNGARNIMPIYKSLNRAALKCVRPGGSVVYSTCTISPMQNDNVVAMALKHFWEETNSDFVVW